MTRTRWDAIAEELADPPEPVGPTPAVDREQPSRVDPPPDKSIKLVIGSTTVGVLLTPDGAAFSAHDIQLTTEVTPPDTETQRLFATDGASNCWTGVVRVRGSFRTSSSWVCDLRERQLQIVSLINGKLLARAYVTDLECSVGAFNVKVAFVGALEVG